MWVGWTRNFNRFHTNRSGMDGWNMDGCTTSLGLMLQLDVLAVSWRMDAKFLLFHSICRMMDRIFSRFDHVGVTIKWMRLCSWLHEEMNKTPKWWWWCIMMNTGCFYNNRWWMYRLCASHSGAVSALICHSFLANLTAVTLLCEIALILVSGVI